MMNVWERIRVFILYSLLFIAHERRVWEMVLCSDLNSQVRWVVEDIQPYLRYRDIETESRGPIKYPVHLLR